MAQPLSVFLVSIEVSSELASILGVLLFILSNAKPMFCQFSFTKLHSHWLSGSVISWPLVVLMPSSVHRGIILHVTLPANRFPMRTEKLKQINKVRDD